MLLGFGTGLGVILMGIVASVHYFGASWLTADQNVRQLVQSVTVQSMLCELLCAIVIVIEGIAIASGKVWTPNTAFFVSVLVQVLTDWLKRTWLISDENCCIVLLAGDFAYLPKMQFLNLGLVLLALGLTLRQKWGLGGIWWCLVLYFGFRLVYHTFYIGCHWKTHVRFLYSSRLTSMKLSLSGNLEEHAHMVSYQQDDGRLFLHDVCNGWYFVGKELLLCTVTCGWVWVNLDTPNMERPPFLADVKFLVAFT